VDDDESFNNESGLRKAYEEKFDKNSGMQNGRGPLGDNQDI